MQDIESARDEAQSYLGKRTFKQKIVIDGNNEDSTTTRNVYWELKKKHIDIAHKNDDIHPDFSVS